MICVAPHTAFYDSICVVLFGPSAVVAKYETASLPFFGSRLPTSTTKIYTDGESDGKIYRYRVGNFRLFGSEMDCVIVPNRNSEMLIVTVAQIDCTYFDPAISNHTIDDDLYLYIKTNYKRSLELLIFVV